MFWQKFRAALTLLFLIASAILALSMTVNHASAAALATQPTDKTTDTTTDMTADKAAGQLLFLPAIQLETNLSMSSEGSLVGYATGSDRTLIRWYWDQPQSPDAFNVYRKVGKGPETLVASVSAITDATAATAILNKTAPAWPDLANNLVEQFAAAGVTDVASLQEFLAGDRFLAQQLANERYPVALIIGWGYLDTEIKAGVETTYRVESVSGAQVTDMGTVVVIPGQITPLAAPTGLSAVNMSPGSSAHALPREGDWATVQRNRRFHQTVYLRWNQNAETDSPTGAWVTGYDLYRQAADGTFQHISPREAIRPMPSSQPIGETTGVEEATAYEEIDFFFADEPPAPGGYFYRVAPRDLLGQIRQWPANQAQFSAQAVGRAYDFIPPSAPRTLVAEPLADNSGVRLTWTMTPTADLAAFRIERTLRLNSATDPAACASDAECWQEIATVAANTLEWVDADGTLESVRWYRVQAVDTEGNRSFFAGPVQGVLHDITPPAPPTVQWDTCNAPGQFCLWGGAADLDVTRLRVACRFSDTGEEMLLDEIDGSQLIAYSIAESVYAPPIDLTGLDCSVYAVDAHGNVSDPGTVEIPWIDSPLPPQVGQPVITQIETMGTPADLVARVRWDITASPLIEGFILQRSDILGETPDFETTVSAGARYFDDDTIIPGRTYLYTLVADLTLNNGEKESLPKLYRATAEGMRSLQQFDLLPLSGTPGNIVVQWDACEIVTGNPPYSFAVYRSIHSSNDYQQLTTLMPFTSCAAGYNDTNAGHTNYWYMVVLFDARTGEAIGYTDPGQVPSQPPVATLPPSYVPQTAQHSRLQNYVYQSSNGVAIVPCSAISPGDVVPGALLSFGGGFTVEIVNAAVQHGTYINGSGLLQLTVNGNPLEITVDFENVTVGDTQLHVCNSGSLAHISFSDLLGAPIQVSPAGAMSYEVIGLTLLPWFASGDNRAWGEIVMDMPDTMRSIDHNGNTSSILRLAGEALRLEPTLNFDFSVDMNTLAEHTCDSPLYAWSLETLPVRVAPVSLLSINESGISSNGGCMRYEERYNNVYAARPSTTNLTAGDANDGFLAGNYSAPQIAINANGLQAEFTTRDDLSWITAYPYGFNVSVSGDVQLSLAQSRIASGAMGMGGIQMGYHQTLTDAGVQPFAATFNQATIDAGGAIYANVQSANEISWLVPGGFRVDSGLWEWYAGPVTTLGLPATVQDGIAQAVMFAPRAGATQPIDTAAGIALPGELEPGLNRRVNPGNLHWGNCCGPEMTFPSALDLYVRHGGLSGRFIAQLVGPVDVPIYGYDGRLDHFEFAFLDNAVWDNNVTGEIDLPFPSNITLRLVDMWLADDGCGACLAGGIVPPDQRNHLLEYWQVQVELHSIEFHPDAPGPEPVCDKLLVANGNITVPHLAIPGTSAPTRLEMEMVFLTDGMAVPHILAYTRGDYLFDNFPYLLEGMRLSNVGENANWQATATLLDPPNINWNQLGFVALDGAFIARYFGPLQGQSEGPENRPEVRFLAWDGGYVGTAEKLAAKKTWVDLELVEIGLNYDMTAFNLQNELHFAAARSHQFLPQKYLDIVAIADEELADDLRIVYLDSSVILEPTGIDIYAGLSSGVAALHAFAEANGGAQPDATTTGNWSAKLGLNQPAKYHSLLTDVWASYGANGYEATTDALDAYDDSASLPDDTDFGGGTGGFLEKAGVNFKRIRGDIQFIDADNPGRIQLDHFKISTQVDILREGEAGSLLYVERMSFEINRHADYILEAVGASSNLYASDLTLDATLRINVAPETRQFEGGLTLYSFNISTVKVIEGSAVMGVGQMANFVGATFVGSASSGASGGSVAMGGSFLVGTIDPASPVLQNHFAEVVGKLSEVESSPTDPTPPDTLNGLYLRMYGDTTLWNDGGLIQLNAGAEIAVWLWVKDIGTHTVIPDEITEVTQLLNFVTFGGKYRFFVHGKILSVISARGDVSLIYWDRPGEIQPDSDGLVDAILNDVINRQRSLTGIAWVAGGVGLCNAETWTSWESRWWDDSWCWNAGAYLEVDVNLTGINPAGLDINAEWEADYEGS